MLQAPLIKKSHGGIVHWDVLKQEITTHLLQNPTAKVTTFIDYYGILPRHNFPNWEVNQKELDRYKRMDNLEIAMKNSISEKLRFRFLPYIQLHEFESLLFSDKSVFDDNFEAEEFDDYDLLITTFETFDCPEDINDGKETAPSKRLEKILANYNSNRINQKVIFGILLANAIGLPKIMEKCPRFKAWIKMLSEI